MFSPYQPVADVQVSTFFREAGFDVVEVTGLRCKSATDIAAVTPEEIGRTVAAIDGPEVDAIVQVAYPAQEEELNRSGAIYPEARP